MDSYNFPAKEKYRQMRATAIARMCDVNLSVRKVAYLDTKEALDTEAYLQMGYRPENLWAVNRSPAQVATLTRRLKQRGLPCVNTVGVSFVRALSEVIPVVDVIDFDGTSCLNRALLRELREIADGRAGSSYVFGLTILAGRESAGVTGAVKAVADAIAMGSARTSFNRGIQNRNHVARLVVALMQYAGPKDTPCPGHVSRIMFDTYYSDSGQQMVWLAAKIEKHRPLSVADVDRLIARPLIPLPSCFKQSDHHFGCKRQDFVRAERRMASLHPYLAASRAIRQMARDRMSELKSKVSPEQFARACAAVGYVPRV